jgi:uncharacterized protein (DUF2336 family)
MSQRTANSAVIAEIESAFRAGNSDKRLATLMRVTDLFVGAADNYSEDETQLFDDVMGHLVQHVESRALAELSRRLAPVRNAPRATVGQLARNDDIEISGPVLAASSRLSDAELTEIASTKSQAHLAKIAVRSTLSETVTEVLVERGDDEVANSVASNAGARFSNTGMAKLVMRADGDERLTESMLRRADVPPRLFRQLTVHATEAVRQKLLTSATPEQQATIKKVMDELAAQVGTKATSPERNYFEAQRLIGSISQDTDLMKSKILEFADGNRIGEAIASLSVLSGVSMQEIDVLFRGVNELGITVLCKAVNLELDTAYAVFMAAHGEQTTKDTQAFSDFCNYYDQLTAPSAQRLLRFWQGRKKVAKCFEEKGL